MSKLKLKPGLKLWVIACTGIKGEPAISIFPLRITILNLRTYTRPSCYLPPEIEPDWNDSINAYQAEIEATHKVGGFLQTYKHIIDDISLGIYKTKKECMKAIEEAKLIDYSKMKDRGYIKSCIIFGEGWFQYEYYSPLSLYIPVI